MGVSKKDEENERLITSGDLYDIKRVFSFALKGAGSNRKKLQTLLMYEGVLNNKIEMTLKVIKETQK